MEKSKTILDDMEEHTKGAAWRLINDIRIPETIGDDEDFLDDDVASVDSYYSAESFDDR